MTTRRDLLKSLPPLIAGAACSSVAQTTSPAEPAKRPEGEGNPALLKLSPHKASAYAPLERIAVESAQPGTLVVRDGEHRVYFEKPIAKSLEFVAGGALGVQCVELHSAAGELLSRRRFRLDCSTRIEDDGGTFGELLKALYYTMCTDGPLGVRRYKGEVYTFWDSWMMDNTQTLKGMKWFWPEAKGLVDMFARSQREDGMIWENIEERTPPMSDWQRRFGYADFDRPAEDGFIELRRSPVESHVEQFFLEAIYYTWKATGDSGWMAKKLDNAIKAVNYATMDPYRWSTKYGLIRRLFTIDTWDFTPDIESALVDGDIMKVDLKKQHMGIFFGDNTNMIAGMRRLAEMLDYVGRNAEAAQQRAKAAEMEDALNKLTWNGEFYVNWVPEDPSFKPDLGVDITRQVALSNAYSMNRGIAHDKCVAIVKTYQRIRREMPATSAGEFYAIYPPYEKGFGAEQQKWEYMNGGVMACTAGELAHGAFEHGYEDYGVDILRRQKKIADSFRGFLPGILRGKAQEPPPGRTFQRVDMRAIVNADIGSGSDKVLSWMDEGGMNLAATMPKGVHEFRDVPFEVIDPATNDGRACLGISSNAKFLRKTSLPVNAKGTSLYLLHASGGNSGLVGTFTIRYVDGSSHIEYLQDGKNVGNWWAPHDSQFETRYGSMWPEKMQVAWRGGNATFGNLGLYVTAFDNPHPEQTIASLEFEALETGAKWMILGATLSDAPAYLPPYHNVSNGMPNNWCAAAVVFALIEGLAGVKDTGVAFDHALIAPRWQAAQVNHAKVVARYGASTGYVGYDYTFDPATKLLLLEFTTSGENVELAILLPNGGGVAEATLDGANQQMKHEQIEHSKYAKLAVTKAGVHTLEMHFV